MKFADRLVGKGLETWVIVQLIVYSLAWMVVLVIPMAVLVATLMAFGQMSQNNEITIVKSAGVSLYQLMLAPFLASIILGFLLLLFNNDVLPDANHRLKYLMQDISNKKPTLSLEPGVFSQEVANYAILARGVDQYSNQLTGITIYDYTTPAKINVVTAEKGKVYFSKDQTKLIMDLREGEIHESDVAETGMYRRLIFKHHRIAMNADQFSFQQSTPGGQRGDRELSAGDMQVIVDSLSSIFNNYKASLVNEVNKFFYRDSSLFKAQAKADRLNKEELLYVRGVEKIQAARNIIIANVNRVEYIERERNKYLVEIHKKYAIPAACIVFVLIGAPLGVMTKKGGFGVAASISLFFFLVYWAFLIGGEKLADRNIISPVIGMWAANIILSVAGILITVKTVRETVTINFSPLQRLFPKYWRAPEEIENENN